MLRIEQRVKFRRIFDDNGFEPAFRPAAIEPVFAVARERAAMNIQIVEQLA